MSSQQASPDRGESLRREEGLRRRADFLQCYRTGRRRHGSLVILYFRQRPPEPPHARIGITASRKVGGSVVRHRVKRRIREIYRRWSERSLLPPLDIVVHVLPAARQAGFQDLKKDLLELLTPLKRPR
ncbi:MAG: ribonuclease P protein component [Thermoanaerobaculia bacterium]